MRWRRVTDLEPVGRVIATTTAARLLRQPLRFSACELAGVRQPRRYTLRGTDVSVRLRHHTPDVAVMLEVFRFHTYAFPPPVQRLLGDQPPRALDLGANVGLFGASLLTRAPQAQITAFEPDPDNAAVHRLTIADNHRGDSWQLIEAAAANKNGKTVFKSGAFAASRIDAAGGASVPVVDVFEHLGGVDLLKMDIEGGEWGILGDPRLQGAPVPAVVIEYHPHGCPTDDPRRAAFELLSGCGYEVAPIFHEPSGVGMLWAWRASD